MSSDRKTVLYVVEDAKSAQFRYRVKNVVEILDGTKKWSAKWILKTELLKVNLDEIDLIIILRQTAKDKKILDFIKKAQASGVKVLFDLDDLIFSYLKLPVLMRSTNSKNVFYWMTYVWGIRRIAKIVDGFVATNDFLGGLLKQVFDKPYVVIPNFLNKAQLEEADRCLKQKQHDGFVVGYFSGSPTHAKDLKMVESQIIKFLNKHDDAKFLIVGYMKFSSEISDLMKRGKIKAVGPVDYLKLIKLQAEVDVNIAPLVVNDFTNCKSELKFFEAAMVETVTIASPTYIFKKVISNSKNGFLAKPDEWYNRLEYIYNNSDKSREIAGNARKYTTRNYYGKEILEKVEEAYGFFE